MPMSIFFSMFRLYNLSLSRFKENLENAPLKPQTVPISILYLSAHVHVHGDGFVG